MRILLVPASPRKGLITDLDHTLWHGIVGEIGVDKICWDLASHRQIHGLYQQLLNSLAEEGILIAVASKNDPLVVQQALERSDLRLPASRIFPVEASWNAKSVAVERILRTWNIAADSVVFVDDSPMELAEVAAAHPGIECIPFPADDYPAAYSMFRRLRDLFGKERISAEDGIRLDSIRRGSVFREADAGGSASELFLEQAEARITLHWNAAEDPRVLELVNKTNQFNLNGVRYSANDWRERLSGSGAWVLAVSYVDKFGPLGKIAVMWGGAVSRATLRVDGWVMSCRAFSRRIEHQCLKVLFERSEAEEIAFDFKPTSKNGPLQDFLTKMASGRPTEACVLTRDGFEKCCPRLYHAVREEGSAFAESAAASDPAATAG